MKKLLLSVLAAAVAASAMAFSVELKSPKMLKNPIPKHTQLAKDNTFGITTQPKMMSRADELSLTFSPAGSPYNVAALNGQVPGEIITQGFEFTAENCAMFAGNKISQFFFYTPLLENNNVGTQPIKSAELVISEGVEEEPFYTQTFNLVDDYLTQMFVTLDTPVTIEADKPLFIGWRYVLPDAGVSSFVFDGIQHSTDEGGYIGIRMPEATKTEWINVTEEIGFLCNGIVIVGENLPQNEIAVVLADAQPVVEVGKPFDFAFQVANTACNDISDIDVTIKIGDVEAVSGTLRFSNPLPFNYAAIGSVSLTAAQAGQSVPVTVTVDKVNGQPNNSTANIGGVYVDIIEAGTGYQRKVVVEEFTGTWCGWCPRGIEVMEYIRENYEGEIIPIAVHFDDAMEAITYKNVSNNYANGAPSAVINRGWAPEDVDLDPILEIYEYVKEIPAIADVEFTVSVEQNDKGKNIATFDVNSVFCFDVADADQKYALSFGVTEDNVGPYTQTNYYSSEFQISQLGYVAYELPGWNELAYSAEGIMYNDVARQLSTYKGVANSIPAQVTAGVKNPFNYSLTLNTKIQDVKNVNYVVYLTNKETGLIENAAYMSAKQVSGVNNVVVENENNAPVEYYNLQGVRVANPSNGVFIRRQGSEVSKIAVK